MRLSKEIEKALSAIESIANVELRCEEDKNGKFWLRTGNKELLISRCETLDEFSRHLASIYRVYYHSKNKSVFH